tara:strand:+ start:2166 stop:2360 length:195 start_codon:yes stop_codon:yes gene_type:complete
MFISICNLNHLIFTVSNSGFMGENLGGVTGALGHKNNATHKTMGTWGHCGDNFLPPQIFTNAAQ